MTEIQEIDRPTTKRGRKQPTSMEVPKPRKEGAVVIKRPNLMSAKVLIRGVAPLVLNAFPQKARNAIMETQMAGSQARKGRKREPKDFDEVYEGACHYSRDGWHGFPASAIRNGSISACRVAGFKMTLAKLSIFVVADGFDSVDGTPLVKITKGKPTKHYMHARPELGGIDIRVRPMWQEGWEAMLNMRWDADQFSADDIINLLMRVGLQVGIGEGRYDSKKSAGLGWGGFEVIQ